MSGEASNIALAIATGGAGQALGSAVPTAAEVGKGIYHCVQRKYDYIKNLEHNYEKLEEKEGYLSSRAGDVKQKIDDRKATEEPTLECMTWLDHVGRVMEKVKELKAKYETVVKSSCGPCSLRDRLKLSEHIVQMTESVVEAYHQIDPHRGILVEKPLGKVPRKSPKNIVDVSSLRQHVENLVGYLKGDEFKKIGIWGMFGVGKTTLLLSLREEVEKLQIFDAVLLVEVPKEGNDLYKMQLKILEQLSLKVEPRVQAEELISRTLEGKKYLLLLDDVSSYIDLCHIGFRDSHNCKVVLSTRKRGICGLMGTDEEIKLEKLSEEDAQKLFRNIVGEQVDRPPFKEIAQRVVRQCGQLPQVIKAVGNHLKSGRSEDYWWEILSRLQSPKMFKLMHLEDIFNAFSETYEKLDDNSKNCLLYAASFPKDHEIYRDHLIECWKVEELMCNHRTFRRARQEGHVSLETFIEMFLFDRCRSSNCVKMPVIFRNAALRVADEQHFRLLVEKSEELGTPSPPPLELWTNAKVVSLMNFGLKELPDRGPVCSATCTLFLQKNEKLVGIPPSFFDHMSTLKLLDLYRTGIRSLPPSISNLANLKGLYLNDCHKLVHLPEEMEQLGNLELLDICRTGIHGFHAVIGMLSHLRCLRVSFTSVVSDQNSVKANGVGVTLSNIIQRLLHLEELTVDADPKDPEWNRIAGDIAAQAAMLEKLSTLSFYFPSSESLEKFTKHSIAWKKGNPQSGNNSMSFNIYVYTERTHKSPRFDVYECSGKRYLRYSDGEDSPDVIKEVLSRTCAFELLAHNGIEYFSDFGIDEMKYLQVCRVEGCNAMIAFFHSQPPITPAFQWLKELHLCQLHHLDAICKGPIAEGSFARLTTLNVDECPNLVAVVSWDMAEQLVKLEHLKVKSCPRVKEIIATDSQSREAGKFVELKTLELEDLEGLDSIHSNGSFKWPELEKVKIKNCKNLNDLCLSTTNAPKLRRVECNRTWWETTGKLNDDVKANLQRLCCFFN